MKHTHASEKRRPCGWICGTRGVKYYKDLASVYCCFSFLFFFHPPHKQGFFFCFQGCEADKKHSSGGPWSFLTRLSVTLPPHFFSPSPATSTPLSSISRLCLSTLFFCPLSPPSPICPHLSDFSCSIYLGISSRYVSFSLSLYSFFIASLFL